MHAVVEKAQIVDPDRPDDNPGPALGVVDALEKTITDRILDGVFEPGQRLVEADLARDLNAGRGSVREALGRLQASRLIVLERNRGAVVANPGPDEIRAGMEVREVIFGLAARGAARSGANQIARAIQVQATIEREIESGHARDHHLRNREFHDAVHLMSGNAHVGSLMEQFRLPTLHGAYFRDMDDASFRESVLDHWQICRAIVRRDADSAEALARTHERSKIDIALKMAATRASTARKKLRVIGG